MKSKFKIFTILLFFLMCFQKNLFANDSFSWQPDNLDRKRAIPNDNTPPALLNPVNELEPLSSNEGIIRRVNLPENKKAVALTFDMCELAVSTTGCDMEIINFLREKKIPATFFMGGKWMRTHVRRVKQIMSENIFEIGNHNWSHGNCALLSEEGLKAQILWTQAEYEILREETGLENLDLVPKFFRLPYGRSSEKALKIISELGLRIIQWDVAAEAGDNSNLKRAQRSAKKVAAMTSSGSILLFHANLVPKGSVNLLRFVVDELEARGFEFVKLSELLSMGEPETVRDGYFSKAGDNKSLDKKFGIDGTGSKKPFSAK